MSSRFDDDVEIASRHLEHDFLIFDAIRQTNSAVAAHPAILKLLFW